MIDINEYQQHEVSELICIKCGKRWIGVYPCPLKDIECSCGETGYVIKTGQTLPDIDKERDNDVRYQNMVRIWGKDIVKRKYREFCEGKEQE